jgi:hypothetical protein
VGASGAIIMSFFGAVFASMTLLLQLKWSGLELGLPFIGFAVMAIAAMLAIRLPGDGFVRPEGSGRVMLWSSIGEGIGLFIVANLLVNLGHDEWLLPAMALVVGLHFIPIAYWAPFRQLYILAVAIMLGGVVGLAIHQPTGGLIAGFTAAGALGLASIAAIRREWLAKRR